MRTKQVKAVYFDMGGVIMNVLPEYSREKAIRNALSGPAMLEFLGEDFEMDSFIEFTNCSIRQRTASVTFIQEDSYRIEKEDFEDFLGRKVPFEVYNEKFWRQVKYMTNCFTVKENAKPTFEALRDMGFILGLISNVYHPAIIYKELFTKWDIIEFFDPLIFSSEFRYKKPHQMIFDYALSWHKDLDASEVMFVGDTWDIDVIGSQSAGMIPVWVNEEYEHEEREGVSVIADIAEIRRLVP